METKLIPSFPNYRVSSCGKLYNNNGKELKTYKKKNGYHQIPLRLNGKYKTRLLHRLVMEAWTGCSPLSVNHINGDKDDNRFENLEYVSHKENMRHASINNLTRKTPLQLRKGGVGYWFPTGRSCMCFTGLKQQEVSALSTGTQKRVGTWKTGLFNEV